MDRDHSDVGARDFLHMETKTPGVFFTQWHKDTGRIALATRFARAERLLSRGSRARSRHRLHHADPGQGLGGSAWSRKCSTPRLGDEKARRETARALERATPFFRRHVGARLQLRRVPELEFRFDESIAQQDRIEQILRDLHARGRRSERGRRRSTDAGTTASPTRRRDDATDASQTTNADDRD